MVLKHNQIALQCSLPSSPLFPPGLLSRQTPEKITTLMQPMTKPYNDAGS